MTKDKKTNDALSDGLKARAISIEALRQWMARLRKASEAKSAPEILQHQRFNMKVLDTQLKTIEQAMSGEVISSEAFKSLPAYKQRQVMTRLENIKGRIEKLLPDESLTGGDVTSDVKYENHSFSCLNDYNKCMKLKSATPFWCNLAFIICFLRSISPFIK